MAAFCPGPGRSGLKRKASFEMDVHNTSFNSDDETKVFGKRQIAESHGQIFECLTLASFPVNDKVQDSQRISAFSSSEATAISVNKTISIVVYSTPGKDNREEIKLDSLVSFVTCTPEEKYFVAVLENSALLIFKFADHSVVYSKKLLGNSDSHNKISSICFYTEASSTTVLVSASDGKIIRLKILLSNDEVQESEVGDLNINNVVDTCIAASMDGLQNLVVAGNNKINLYSLDSYDVKVEFPLLDHRMQAKSLCFTPSTHCLLALFQNGCVMMLCPETLVCFNVLDTAGLVQQMSLIRGSDDTPEQLLILSKLDAHHSISLINTDGFEENFTLSVGSNAHLVDNFGESNDVMFLEDDNRCPEKNNILLRTVSKSQVEFRLHRLIRQQKYTEALAFAAKYQLDEQQVYQAQVTHYVNTKIDKSISRKLLEVLTKINDCGFVAEACLRATMPDLEETLELIKYGHSRVKDAQGDQKIKDQLRLARLRLGTYCLVEVNLESDWLEFYRGYLMLELISLLSAGQVSCAKIIWGRHRSELLEHLDLDAIPGLINIVPLSIGQNLVLSWLELFVPDVLKKTPEVFSLVAALLVEKIEKYANVRTENWPREALDFCTSTVKILEPDELDELTGWLTEWQNPMSPSKQLKPLQKSLSDLCMLKEKLHVHLSLDEYSQLKNVDGLYNLLRKVGPQYIKYLINNFSVIVPPDCGLDCEEIISSFIELELHKLKSVFEPQNSEERIFALFDCLVTPEKILHCINKILRNAHIPWSKLIMEFAARVMELSESAAEAVKVHHRVAKVKNVILKYELPQMLSVSESHLDFNYILLAIFHHQLPEMLEDAMMVVSIKPSLESEVHALYVEQLLTNYKFGGAFEYLKNMRPEMQKTLLMRLICKAEAYIFFESIEEVIVLAAFLSQFELEEGLDSDAPYRIKKITNAVTAFEKYKTLLVLNTNLAQMDFNSLICEVSKSENEQRAVKQALEIGDMYNLSATQVLLYMTQHNWCEEKIGLQRCIVLDHFSPSTMTSKEVNILLELCSNNDLRNLEMLELLQGLLGSALVGCPADRIVELLGESRRIRELADLLRQEDCSMSMLEVSHGVKTSSQDPLSVWSFNPQYYDLPINVPASAVTLQVLHKFESTVPSNNGASVERLFSNLEVLQIQHCDLLALSFVSRLAANSSPSTLGNQLYKTQNSLMESLLAKILQERKADLFLALDLLLSLPSNEATAWLERSIARVRSDCNHLFRMTQLGIDFSLIVGITEMVPRLVKYNTMARWGKRAKKLGVSSKGVMSSHIEDKGIVLQQIMTANPSESLETMFEFCKDFGINVNVEIIALMQNMILSWEPTVTVELVENEERMNISRDRLFEVRIMNLATRLHQSSYGALEGKLDSIWDKLNVYYYEMYECLLRIKKMLNPNFESVQSNVLLFLGPYKRTIPPQAAEVEKWMRKNPEGTVLPPIADMRLPFPSFLQEVENIIKCEVNLENYKIWLQAPSVLNCDPDQICAAAITNSVGDTLHLTNLDEWDNQSREVFVNDVADCVNCMKDMNTAAAILDYASKRIPLGQARISLVDMCSQKLMALEEVPKDMEEKVSQKLILYCIVNLLHEHKLACPEYLMLATRPEDLIDALYKDASIVDRFVVGVGNYPDIHLVVGNIGHIASLDVEQIRSKILGSLLFPDSGGTESLDESFLDVTLAWQQNDAEASAANKEINVNLLKAQYMLEAGAKQAHVDHILSICNNTNITCKNSERLRAWRLLLWLLPLEQICEFTEMDKQAVMERLSVLYFLSELEVLHGKGGTTEQQFEATDKVSVIKSLWHHQASNPRALKLMAHLCIHYEIGNAQIWCNILTKMVHLTMDMELEKLLPKLEQFSEILETNAFIAAWNHIIIAPFTKADCPMTEEQSKSCRQSLMLLHKCPIPFEINTQTLFDISLKKERVEFAAILLPTFPNKIAKSLCQELLLKLNMSDLNKKLVELEIAFPGFPVQQALAILENT